MFQYNRLLELLKKVVFLEMEGLRAVTAQMYLCLRFVVAVVVGLGRK